MNYKLADSILDERNFKHHFSDFQPYFHSIPVMLKYKRNWIGSGITKNNSFIYIFLKCNFLVAAKNQVFLKLVRQVPFCWRNIFFLEPDSFKFRQKVLKPVELYSFSANQRILSFIIDIKYAAAGCNNF